MSFGKLQRAFTIGMLLASIWVITRTPSAGAQDEMTRKVKSRVAPSYPELARKMNITGAVKVLVTVAPNGSVKDVKLMGGHPVLANAAMDAVRKWRYEPAAEESTGVVEFRFDPQQQ